MNARTLETTFYHHFTTRQFSTGAPFALVSGTVSAYEDASDTEITAGITLAASPDSRTGMNRLTIVATTANGYEAGKDYSLVLTVGTVDSVSVVGEVIGQFRIKSAAEHLYMYEGPRGPGAYFDDTASNTTSVVGVDGTPLTPNSTAASAKTTADNIGTKRIYIVNDSTFTVPATMEDYEFIGIGEMSYNVVALASQDVDHSYCENVLISGVQGGTARFQANGCILSSITGMEISACGCVIADGNPLVLRNDCMFDSCWSAVAGTDTPTLDINSVASVNVYFRHYSGGIQIDNAVATTVMSWEGIGQIIIDATCTSLSIVPRGVFTYTDNGTTTNLLTDDAALNLTNVINSVWDEPLTGAAHNGATTSGKRLRQASEVTPVLHEGTAQAGGASTITLAAGASATNDLYHDAYVSLIAGTGVGQVRSIIAYDGGTKIATVSKSWATNPAADSEYVVAGSSSVDIHTIQDDTASVDNLKSACDNYSATRGLTGTAVPAAAADAAGGLPISDGGGLDMDAILADTNELQTDDVPGLIAALNDIATSDLDTALATYDGPTNAEMVARTHSAAVIAKLNAAALGIVVGTVDTGAAAATSTTLFSSDITEATADHFIGRIIVFYDSTDVLYGQATDITDYELVSGQGKFTFTELTSAPVNADKFVIL